VRRYLLEHGNVEQVTEVTMEQIVGGPETCSVGFEVYYFHYGTDIPTSVCRGTENNTGCGDEIKVIGT
jgi:hypothetical protein